MTESKTPAIALEPESPALLTPGTMLRNAREASGQTHATVGEALHLTVHYIKALENDDYSKLPGLIFVKGYIRAYGLYLKMDVDALLRSHDSLVGSSHDTTVQGPGSTAFERRQFSRRRRDQSHGWALVTGFIVIVALGAGWWFVGREPDSAASASDSSSNQATAADRTAIGSTAIGSTATNSMATNSTAADARATPAAGNGSQTNRPFIAAPANGDATTQPGPAPMATGASALPQQTVPVTSALARPAETDPAFDSAAGDAISVSEAAAITTSPTADSLPDNTLPTADVTSAATAISATGEVIQSGASNSNVLLQTTVTDDGLTIIPSADGSRQVSMFRAGSDELLLRFVGDSWVEVDDGANVRLYSDMLNTGDTLTIQGTAPFQVLLGNAANVEVNFNDMAVNIASSIRADNTARVQLANPDNEASVSGTGVAQ